MRFCLALLLTLHLTAAIVERLVIAVGRQVVTELQLDEELRVTALLNHKPIVRSLDERRAAADRMVQQLLIRSEMELSRYPLPPKEEVDHYYQQIVEAEGNAPSFENELRTFHLTADSFRRHLELQLTMLYFIRFRFRPDATVTDAEIEQAYARQTASWAQSHTGRPPTLEASREVLRVMLIEEKTDSALNAWLAERRNRLSITYFDKSLE